MDYKSDAHASISQYKEKCPLCYSTTPWRGIGSLGGTRWGWTVSVTNRKQRTSPIS